jgi:hypothetical protein
LREAARYLPFGDADPVDILPLEIERDRVHPAAARDKGRSRRPAG